MSHANNTPAAHEPPWANAIAIFVFAAGVGIATDAAYQSALIASADSDPQTKKVVIDAALARLQSLRDLAYYVALIGTALLANRVLRSFHRGYLFWILAGVGAVVLLSRLVFGIWR